MLLHSQQITSELNGATLFLDTNVFSCAFRNPELGSFLLDLREARCALVTIPSVLFEVTRGSTGLDVYNQRTDALKELVTYLDPIRFTEPMDEFSVVMAKLVSPKNSQYTDFLLASCLYKYRMPNILLMTSDLQSMPDSIFDRPYMVTSARDDEVTNFGIFRFNEVSYDRAAASLLKVAS